MVAVKRIFRGKWVGRVCEEVLSFVKADKGVNPRIDISSATAFGSLRSVKISSLSLFDVTCSTPQR